MGSGVIAPKAGRRTRPSRCQEIGHDPHELVEPIMMHPVPRTGDVGDPRIAEMRRPAVLLRVARPALHAAAEQGRTRDPRPERKTGRAACRERGWPDGKIPVVAASLKKKKN